MDEWMGDVAPLRLLRLTSFELASSTARVKLIEPSKHQLASDKDLDEIRLWSDKNLMDRLFLEKLMIFSEV